MPPPPPPLYVSTYFSYSSCIIIGWFQMPWSNADYLFSIVYPQDKDEELINDIMVSTVFHCVYVFRLVTSLCLLYTDDFAAVFNEHGWKAVGEIVV